jgi:hypothetical protein
MADVVPPSAAVAFVTKMSEKHCITWCNSSEKSAKDSQY